MQGAQLTKERQKRRISKKEILFCLRFFRWEGEKRRHQQMGGNKDNHVLKMVLTAIFAGMGFALSSVVWFPNMAPFQHFINVLAAVFVGPFWRLSSPVFCV